MHYNCLLTSSLKAVALHYIGGIVIADDGFLWSFFSCFIHKCVLQHNVQMKLKILGNNFGCCFIRHKVLCYILKREKVKKTRLDMRMGVNKNRSSYWHYSEGLSLHSQDVEAGQSAVNRKSTQTLAEPTVPFVTPINTS